MYIYLGCGFFKPKMDLFNIETHWNPYHIYKSSHFHSLVLQWLLIKIHHRFYITITYTNIYSLLFTYSQRLCVIFVSSLSFFFSFKSNRQNNSNEKWKQRTKKKPTPIWNFLSRFKFIKQYLDMKRNMIYSLFGYILMFRILSLLFPYKWKNFSQL